MNHLMPGVKKDKFSEHEQDVVVEMHSIFNKKWSKIVKHLPGRSDNDIKNFWHTRTKRSVKQNSTQNNIKDVGVEAPSNFTENICLITNGRIYDPALWESMKNATKLSSIQLHEDISDDQIYYPLLCDNLELHHLSSVHTNEPDLTIEFLTVHLDEVYMSSSSEGDMVLESDLYIDDEWLYYIRFPNII